MNLPGIGSAAESVSAAMQADKTEYFILKERVDQFVKEQKRGAPVTAARTEGSSTTGSVIRKTKERDRGTDAVFLY